MATGAGETGTNSTMAGPMMTSKEGVGTGTLSSIMTSGPRSSNPNSFLNHYQLTLSS